MFENIITWIKGLINKMFNRDDLKRIIGQEIKLSDPMIKKINLWGEMFAGEPPWADENIKSLRIEQGICKELANISLNEMTVKVRNNFV